VTNEPLRDPNASRYRVTEALLVPHGDGSVWRLTFTPEPVSESGDGHVTLELLPSLIDNMFFDVSYSREEITSLSEGTWDG
jgi:hypothetical protein